jgi:hypothetical protein
MFPDFNIPCQGKSELKKINSQQLDEKANLITWQPVYLHLRIISNPITDVNNPKGKNDYTKVITVVMKETLSNVKKH